MVRYASIPWGGRHRHGPSRRGSSPSLSYIPSLDGVRAFAVLGVMVFHGGVTWLPGGFLGVDAFFVLSGFLITTLLIGEWQRIRTIRLGDFWARRARRLLPALLLMLLLVAAYAGLVAPAGTYPGLRLDGLSTLFYVANWHFILVGANYFNQTGLPSPLTHTWSLAIEEQFYVVWPLVVLLVLRCSRTLRPLLAVSLAGVAASAAEMAVLFRTGSTDTRLYYGTDTHAQSLLAGAALAIALAMVVRRRADAGPDATRSAGDGPGWAARTRAGRNVLTVVGLVGLAGSAWLWSHVGGGDALLYQGGFLLAAVATGFVLLAGVCAERAPVAVFLSLAPLRYIGRISYGMYLWHYPLFIWLDGARTGLSGYSLLVPRIALTVVVASLSYHLVEQPIRQGTFFRQWRAWVATPVAVAGVVAVLTAATVAPALPPIGGGAPGGPIPLRGPRVRMLVVGGSVAFTLGFALGGVNAARKYGVTEANDAQLGCGLAIGTRTRAGGKVGVTVPSCQPHPPPGHQQWPEQWRQWVAGFHPDVVVLLAGRWEVVDRTYRGHWTNILHPAFARYVKRQLELAVRLATARGARMVLMTAPCFQSGEQPDGRPWPEDSPARLAVYNRLVRQVAAEHPGSVTLFDLHALVCPRGTFEQSIDGVQVRDGDGIHFATTAGPFLDPAILPTVVRIGRQQMADHPSEADRRSKADRHSTSARSTGPGPGARRQPSSGRRS